MFPQSHQSCHSCTQHIISFCSTFLSSIIKIYQRVLGLQSREKKSSSSNSNTRRGDNSKHKKKPKLSFLYVTCRLVLFFITTKYHQNIPKGRALTRISKTGVQDSHLAKSRSPTGKSGSHIPKSGSPTNSRISLRVVVHVYLIIL